MDRALIPDWERCRPFVADALAYSHGTHSIGDVEAAIAAGEATFWPGQGSAMVTEILDLPGAKVLHFWLCGGDLDELQRMRAFIEGVGQAQGCTKASTAGRRGWSRVLKDDGYDFGWEVCVKDLTWA
jgi:hypothetical protein